MWQSTGRIRWHLAVTIALIGAFAVSCADPGPTPDATAAVGAGVQELATPIPKATAVAEPRQTQLLEPTPRLTATAETGAQATVKAHPSPTAVPRPPATPNPEATASPTPTKTPIAVVTYDSIHFGYSFDYPENWDLLDLGQQQFVTAPLRSVEIVVSVDILPRNVSVEAYTATTISLWEQRYAIRFTSEPESSSAKPGAIETHYRLTEGGPGPTDGRLTTLTSGRLGFTVAAPRLSASQTYFKEVMEVLLDSLSLPGADFEPPPPRITDAKMATLVDEVTNELLEGGSTFTTDTTKLYVHMRAHSVPVGSNIKLVWAEVDTQGSLIRLVDQSTSRWDGTDTFWASLLFEQGWPPGLYESRVFINDELFTTVPFSITRILAIYSDEALGFVFSHPRDWTFDDSDPRGIQLRPSSDSRIVILSNMVGPTTPEAAASALMDSFAEEPGFREISRTPIEDNAPGYLIRFEWSAENQPLRTDLIINVKGARFYVVSATALETSFDQHQADFRQVMDSFKITFAPTTDAIDAGVDLKELLDVIGDRVTGIRGLPAISAPISDFQTKDNFKIELESEPIDEESEQEIQKLKDFCLVLDLCVESDDLLQAYQEVSGEGIVGYYDLEDKSLTVILDGADADLPVWLTYAHEYAHALQDQQFDLSNLNLKEENSDSSRAVGALIEGDAILVETLFYESLPLDQQVELATSIEKIADEFFESPEVAQAPRIISETFGWEHSAGFKFVFYLYVEGGWKAIDDAYENLPQSTEQILHPEKYLSQEAPHTVSLPDLVTVLGTGWQQQDTGGLGEFLTGIYLGTYLAEDQAESAAEGWGGDRFALLKDDQARRLMVIRFSWDASEDAYEFFQAYLEVADSKGVRRQNKWDKRGAFKACNLDANRLRQFSDLPTSVRLDSFASPPVSSPVWRLAVRGTYPPA